MTANNYNGYIPNNNIYAGNGLISSPMTINAAYNYPMTMEEQYSNANLYKVTDQLEIEKEKLKILKRIIKIDPDAKELKNNATMHYYNQALDSRSFLSLKIWDQPKLLVSFSIANDYMNTLSVYKKYKICGSDVKIYACHQLPILSKVGIECVIQNIKFLEEKNRNIAKKVGKEVCLFIKKNQLKISSESEVSETISNYINFM